MISCRVRANHLDLDGLHAELAEIDENLIRSDLTPAQEASAIFRRKAIYEELHPETKHGANQHTRGVGNSPTPPERFTSATAKATGKDESSVRRAAARGRP
jgi:ParB family chromosome partitioning protein